MSKDQQVTRTRTPTAEHTTAEQTTHTNTERATAQRRLIVEVVVAALKIVVVRFAAERRPLALGRRGVASPDLRPVWVVNIYSTRRLGLTR